MTRFVASNGVPVSHEAGVELVVEGINFVEGEDRIQALREYFLHERDEQLGRWRDPNHPGIFAAPISDLSDVVQIVKEEGGTAYGQFRRKEVDRPAHDPMVQVAKAYFGAHPPKKPWHDAQPGEVWVLNFQYENRRWTEPGIATAGEQFTTEESEHSIYSEEIVDATRIYPAPEEGVEQ